MSGERRREDREECYEILMITSRDALGGTVVLPVMLHNRSPSGLGGVYVGQAPLDTGRDYFHEDEQGGVQRMRLVWIEPVANHVFILGFAIL